MELVFPMVVAAGQVIRKEGFHVKLTFVPVPEPTEVWQPELFDKGIPERRPL